MSTSFELGVYSLALIGFLSIASKFTFNFTALFKFNPKKAKYAVVTGASEGIGKEFCLELARRGHDIILMARSVDKLEAVAKECTELGAETVVIPFDFAKATPAQWNDLKKQLDSKEIGVLINNVGVSHDFPVPFLEESPERCEMITAVNIDSLMKITRIVLPQMIKRKYGLVLNNGSMLGKVPNALLSVYSGSKAFVRHWSQCIAEEVKQYNVHVEHSNTMLVQTSMSKIRKSSYFIPTPEQFARKTLARVGYGYDSTLYPSHAIVDTIANFLPVFFQRNQCSAMHVDIRKRALRKQAREAKSE